MIEKITNLQCYLVLIFIKLLGAQEVPNTSSNQGSSPSLLQPRFSDDGALRFPNFGSGIFDNPTSNYPTNSFLPYGNQNINMQRPQQGPGLSYPNPNQQVYPNSPDYQYQGDSINPSPNYQRPQYPNQNIQYRPVQEEYPNQVGYPYQRDSNTRYPNYQRPLYPNRPDDINRPYPNGEMPINQGSPGQSFQYPSQNNQYPYQPNQYYPQYNSQNQNYIQGQPGNFPNYQSNNNPDTSIHFPTNDPVGVNVDLSAIRYPNQGIPYPGGSGNVLPGSSVNPGFNNVFQNQLPNNQGNNPNYNDYDTTAILGKPVIVPPTTTSPGQTVLDNSNVDAANQNKCIQDCPVTSEYNPMCGTDNVTYINPGKMNCAQKCGVAVQLQRRGRCPGDIVRNALEIS